MLTKKLAIPDVILLTPTVHRDDRGAFCETFHQTRMQQSGIDLTFVQDNQSFSSALGTLRGLHFQTDPHQQGKLVRVLQGSIFDVAVDIRPGSPTFGRYVSAELRADDWTQLWVPAGFAHGFLTLEDNTAVAYKVTDHYAPDCDCGIQWDDADIAIDWPLNGGRPILSEKDANLPSLEALITGFLPSDKL